MSGSCTGLFIMSFDKSIINSIIMHHFAGLNSAQKVSLKYISAHMIVTQIYWADVEACICVILYAASRLNLYSSIVVREN